MQPLASRHQSLGERGEGRGCGAEQPEPGGALGSLCPRLGASSGEGKNVLWAWFGFGWPFILICFIFG